jgi:hypothetical protein
LTGGMSGVFMGVTARASAVFSQPFVTPYAAPRRSLGVYSGGVHGRPVRSSVFQGHSDPQLETNSDYDYNRT